MADQPALGPNGHLLDASKIIWYNDPDDNQPIQPGQHGIILNSFILSQIFIFQLSLYTIYCLWPYNGRTCPCPVPLEFYLQNMTDGRRLTRTCLITVYCMAVPIRWYGVQP